MWSHIRFCGSGSGSGSGQNHVASCGSGSGSGSGSGQVPRNLRSVKVVPKFLESSLERTILLATGNGKDAIFYSQKRPKMAFDLRLSRPEAVPKFSFGVSRNQDVLVLP